MFRTIYVLSCCSRRAYVTISAVYEYPWAYTWYLWYKLCQKLVVNTQLLNNVDLYYSTSFIYNLYSWNYCAFALRCIYSSIIIVFNSMFNIADRRLPVSCRMAGRIVPAGQAIVSYRARFYFFHFFSLPSHDAFFSSSEMIVSSSLTYDHVCMQIRTVV